jgi:hypothetical protein
LRDLNDVANNLKILGRNLAATINQIEFELLALCQTFKASTFNRADMDENVLTASFLLDKAEAFLAVEEFDGAFASTDNLSRHAVKPATTAAARATAPATWAAAKAAAITVAAAETVTTASAAIPITTAEAVTTTVISEVTRGRKTVATAKWIEAVFAETVALVPTAPTSPIVSHN